MVTQCMGRNYKIANALEDIRIAAYFGGLGDSLQFSTLPELFSEAGHDVYVWDKAYFRNPEIKELVWDCNPFVKGERAGQWNAGDIPGLKYENLSGNVISNWETLFGFKPTNKYPKIYYEPKDTSKARNSILLDLTSISGDYRGYSVSEAVDKLVSMYPGRSIYQLTFHNSLNNPPASNKIQEPWSSPNNQRFLYNDFESEKIVVNSIFEYCDMIYSSDVFITLHSGGHAVSSAIKEYNSDLEVHSIIRKVDYDYCIPRGFFLFDNIKYSVIAR